MKRKIYLLFAVSAALMTWSCSDDEETIHVTEVNVSEEAFTLFAGDEKTLTAEVLPANAANVAVEWSSSATDVATVDASGKVTAVSAGTAVITVTAKDNAVSGTATVTVVNGFILGTERKEIKAATYDDSYLGETEEDGSGGISFYFYPTTETGEDASEFISIDIPKERLNTTFPLTTENPYDWSWWIQYQNNDTEVYYEGFGSEEGMANVVSGTMSSKVEAGGEFIITFDVLLDDGKTLKGRFAGVMSHYENNDGRMREGLHNMNR